MKPTRCTNFTNLFYHETLHVSDSYSVHHQEFIHCTLSNGICHTGFEDSFRAGPGWNVFRLEIPTQYCSTCDGEGMFLEMLKNAVGCFMPYCSQAIRVFCEEFPACFTGVMLQAF
jgi:hypothetical protein